MVTLRKTIFANNEIYHVFNRSVAREEIFNGTRGLERIMDLFVFYRFPQRIRFSVFKNLNEESQLKYLEDLRGKPPLVSIFAFALMPDHYHLLMRQNLENGLRLFASNFQNAFAKYFNTKKKRGGSLFQNPFKAKRVEDDEQLIHISRYIHLNPVTSFLIEFKDLEHDSRTSFPYYFGKAGRNLVETDPLLKMFASLNDYKRFMSDQVDYQRKLNLIKNQLLE